MLKFDHRIIVLIALFTIAVLVGCSRENNSQNTFSIEQFENAMKDRGYNFEIKDVQQDFLPTTRKRMIIDDKAIDIYQFSNDKKMETEASRIASDGCSYSNDSKTVNVTWVSLPHFYKKGSLIIQYIGEDEIIISDLKDILGEQFVGYVTDSAVEKGTLKVETTSTATVIKTVPQQEQTTDTSIGTITLSKNEITSGRIISGGVTGEPPEYTLTTDELGEFIDNFNSLDLTEKDREGTPQIHTALSPSVNVELFKRNGTRLIITTYWDGETDVTDDQSGYALFNKDFADYILSLQKYIYEVDTTTSDALQQ